MSPVPTPPPSEPAPSLRPVEEIDAARLAAMNAWRQAAGALREYLGVPEGAYADGFEVRVGCVVDDLGRMSEAQRRFFLDVVPALLARLRAAEETLAAVGALHQRHAFDGRSDHHHAASVAALGAIAPYRHVCTEKCFETFVICAHDGLKWPCPTAAALAEGASR